MTRKPILQSVLPLLVCLLAAAAAAQEPDATSRLPSSVVRAVYLQHADVHEVAKILRSVGGIPHLAVDGSLAAIDVRGQESIDLAARLIEAHDRRRAEVRVDVELLRLDREKLRAVGRELAGGEGGRKLPSRLSPSQLERLVAAGGGRQAVHSTLSVQAGGEAEMMIGDRVPITVDGQGTVSYQEVGFRLLVRPRVHPETAEVTLGFELEISRRESASATPVIATRRVTSNARLAGGTTYLLAGLGPGDDDPEATTEVVLALTSRIHPGS